MQILPPPPSLPLLPLILTLKKAFFGTFPNTNAPVENTSFPKDAVLEFHQVKSPHLHNVMLLCNRNGRSSDIMQFLFCNLQKIQYRRRTIASGVCVKSLELCNFQFCNCTAQQYPVSVSKVQQALVIASTDNIEDWSGVS